MKGLELQRRKDVVEKTAMGQWGWQVIFVWGGVWGDLFVPCFFLVVFLVTYPKGYLESR